MSATKRQKTIAQHDIPSNLISVKDVSSNYLNYLLKEAEDMKVMVLKRGGDERLKHRVLASVFYEVRCSIYDAHFSAFFADPIDSTFHNLHEMTHHFTTLSLQLEPPAPFKPQCSVLVAL